MASAPPPAAVTRVGLAHIRSRWEKHAPEAPLYLEERLPHGATISEFCVHLLFTQRQRRGDSGKKSCSDVQPEGV